MRFYAVARSEYPDLPDCIIGEVVGYDRETAVELERDATYLTREQILARSDGAELLARWERGDDSAWGTSVERMAVEGEAESVIDRELYRALGPSAFEAES